MPEVTSHNDHIIAHAEHRLKVIKKFKEILKGDESCIAKELRSRAGKIEKILYDAVKEK